MRRKIIASIEKFLPRALPLQDPYLQNIKNYKNLSLLPYLNLLSTDWNGKRLRIAIKV
jgi:hypothetical protein